MARHGSAADYSEATLADLDRVLDEVPEISEDEAVDLACYFGDVVCRALGGRWSPLGAPAGREQTLEIVLPNGSKFWPIRQVSKRLSGRKADVPTLVLLLQALREIDTRH